MAKQSNGKLWFEAGIDRSQLSKGVTAINKDFQGLQTNAGRTGSAMSDMWKTAAAGVGAYLSATAALDLGKQIINLTRQRELMEKSFEVMLGGADAAAQKIEEINEYAIFSPYTFDGVAKGVQTMSAFGVATEDLMPTLRMLGDVAAGNQQRFESLSLVYGQIQSAGRLMGQDLLQLINAGFNPLQIISQQTGKSMLALKKEMEEGAISFDMVAGAFKTATSEGGKFYGMTTKMADSIEAAKSTFESAWVEKQIEWGKAARDNIQTMYEFGTTVVGQAETIAKSFGVLVATVGTYKAAMIALSVYQTTYAGIVATEAAALVAKNAAMGISISLETAATVVKGKITAATVAQTLATKAATVAQGALNAIMKVNPVVLIVSALAAATAGYFLFRKEVNETAETLSTTEKIAAEYADQLEDEKTKVERLNRVMRDSTAPMNQRLRALKDLKAIIPDYNIGLSEEGEIINDNTAAVENYIKAKEKELKLKIYEDQLSELYGQQIKQEEALDTLIQAPMPDAMDNAQYAKILEQQRKDAVELARFELDKTNAEIAEIESKIGGTSATTATPVAAPSAETESKSGFKLGDNDFQAQLDTWRALSEQRNEQEAQDLENLQNTLKAYQDYAEQVVDIEKWRAEELEKVKGDEAKTDEVNALADFKTEEAAEEAGIEPEGVASEFTGIVNEIINEGIQETIKQIGILEKELNKLQKEGKGDTVKAAKLSGQLAASKKVLQEQQNELNGTNVEGLENSIDTYDRINNVLENTKETVDNLQGAFGDMLGDIGNDALSTISTVATSTIGIISLITTTAWTGAEAIKTVEKASVILAIISMAIQIIMAIINVFNKYFSENAKLQAEIDKSKEKVEELNLAYEKLESTINRLDGRQFYTDQIKLLDNLKKAEKEYLLQKELSDKKLDNISNKNSKKYEKEIEQNNEITDNLQENIDKQYDIYQDFLKDLATTDLQSFGEDLADDIVDGWAEGLKDMSEIYDETLDELFKNMLKKQLSLDFVKAFQKTFERLNSSFDIEGGDTELTNTELEAIRSQYESDKLKADAISEGYKAIFDSLGLSGFDTSTQSSTGGFTAMSQDTGDELNGRFTAVQANTATTNIHLASIVNINTGIKQIAETMNDSILGLWDVAQDQLIQQQLIATNTSALIEIRKTMGKMYQYMQENI